jgi:LmbE family N-acetylglucosaminyl deacetylase
MITSNIKDFNPHFVLTLEPDGIYGHPDHVALTKVVTTIFKKTNSAFKLIYATVDSNYYQPSEGSRKMAKDPDSIKPLKPNLVLKLSLVDSYKKLKALRAHRSQFQVNYKFIKKWHSRKLIRTEMFYLVNDH